MTNYNYDHVISLAPLLSVPPLFSLTCFKHTETFQGPDLYTSLSELILYYIDTILRAAVS